MHENQERPVAADTRNRVIADCAALLPLAQSACAAMDEGYETEVLRLFCGESQRKTLRRLGRLIDDLRLCRTASDLPGPEPEIVELRNASFKVFRGLSARVGNSLDLTKRFRSGAVDFFRMLIRRDPVLLQLVHRGPWRRFAYDLLFAAIKANQYLLQLRQVPSALLRPFRPLVRFHFSNTQMRDPPHTKYPSQKPQKPSGSPNRPSATGIRTDAPSIPTTPDDSTPSSSTNGPKPFAACRTSGAKPRNAQFS